ncbi:MAG: hypothetical protein ACFFC7_33655 [Candidatus Hermodarchaeota archaeon]
MKKIEQILKIYDYAIELVKQGNYEDRIRELRERIEQQYYKSITVETFFREYVWVVFTSGFREHIVRKYWKEITKMLYNFRPEKVREMTIEHLLVESPIKNRQKLKAILEVSKKLTSEWLAPIHNATSWKNIQDLFLSKEEFDKKKKKLPYIAEVTVFHLMRNIGVNCFKCDTHIEKLSQRLNINPEVIFDTIINHKKEKYIGIADYILWRGCEMLNGGPEELVDKALEGI